MDNFFTSLSNSISAQVKMVVTQPIFWVMLFLLLGCLVLTYGAAAHHRLSSSIINTMRQFGAFLIDTFNSIVQALRSLFGFLDVLRMLFFGHLGRSTLYVLTNYAIIFLSMASFATTLQGLYSLIGWTGILVSFGVQVLELVATMGIIICWVPPWARSKENVRYAHFSTAQGKICTDKAADCPAKKDEESSEMTDEEKKVRPLKRKERQPFLWGRVRRWVLFLVLFFAYASSVFFSYCYMFDAIVMPGIAYDDYIESIDLVNDITEAFEDELAEYRTQLMSSLTRFNGDVVRYSGIASQDMGTIDSQISSLEREMSSASGALQAAQAALQELATDDPVYDQFYQMYETARQRYEDVQSRLADLQTVQSGSLYSLYQQIQLLDQFYANPLYLMEGQDAGDNEADRAALEGRLNEAFNVVMNQGYTPHIDEIEADADGIRAAFQNYTVLCKYYAAHGNDGLDLTDTDSGEGVTSLLANRAEILDKYMALGEELETPTDADEDTVAQPQQSASGYLNEETGKLLIAAMRALEDVPRFSVVGEIWSDLTVREPGIAGHLQSLNEKYRAASGQLSLQERAVSKTSHNMTAILSFLVALFLDAMIIFLCFLRGREYYANNIRNRRQVVSLLFIIPSTKEEQDKSERSRRLVLMGAVLGCLIYLLYYRFRPNAQYYDLLLAFVLVVASILLMALLSTLHAALPKKTHGKDEDRKDTGDKNADAKDTDSENADVTSRPKKEEKSPVEERLYPVMYELLMKKMQKDWFYRCCTALRLKHDTVVQASKNYQREKNLWRGQEDHKIRSHLYGKNDYEYIVTSVDKRMECYIMDDDIRDAGLTFQFSILQSHRLAYPVMAPPARAVKAAADKKENSSEDGPEPSSDPRPAYLLTGEFIRLLYECVMLRTIIGDGLEFNMADDLLDYEREDDDDGD